MAGDRASKPRVAVWSAAIAMLASTLVAVAFGPPAAATFPGAVGKIAFTTAGGIWVMNADGTDPVDLTGSQSASQPAWSPDGTRIAYHRNTGLPAERGLYVMDADGGNAALIAEGYWAPAWSPSGAQLAATQRAGGVGQSDIYVMNTDGSSAVNVTNDPAEDHSPAWSPDGSRIAFTSNRSGTSDIWLMDPDGGNLVNLTNRSDADFGPDWSPDGTRLAFQTLGTLGAQVGLVDADGGNLDVLPVWDIAEKGRPSWSPDGAELAFDGWSLCGDDGMGIFRVDVATLAYTQIAGCPGQVTGASGPVWQPRNAPEPVDDDYAVDVGETLVVAAPGVLGNDGDPNGDPISMVEHTSPAEGALTLLADGSLTYDPGSTTALSVAFSYRAGDGVHTSLPATVTIEINRPPVAANDGPVAAGAGQTTVVAAPGVLGNDADPNGDPLRAVKVTDPAHGALTLAEDGSWAYDHGGSTELTDSFTYRADDGSLLSDPATVTIAVNQPPAAGPDGPFALDEGGTVALAAPGVLGNDTDPNGDPLTAVELNGPDHGVLTLGADGSFTYVHDGGESTSDAFAYVASDGLLTSPPVTVDLAITPINDPPVAVDDGPYHVAEGGVLDVPPPGWLANDSDAEGDPPASGQYTFAAHGEVEMFLDGGFFYVHDGSETTSDGFEYYWSDGTDDSNNAAVSIVIDPVNDPPIAVDDGPYTVAQGGTLEVAPPGWRANDSDAEGDAPVDGWFSDAEHGDVEMFLDGAFVYVHDGSDTTTDSFDYFWSDGTDDSNDATVSIVITVVLPGELAGTDVGLVDPSQGMWHLRHGATGAVHSFFYGDPGDIPFLGDWDCDGVATPGLFRQSDAFAYLRNSNSVGIAHIRFFFGDPSDVPLAGDFDGDGCDTLSIYRPSEQRFYIINELGEDEGGLGAAEYSFTFGNPGDKPVVGDWDGDGVDEVGLHRESSGFFYYRNSLDTGVASGEFYFGDPGDRFVAGDWGTVDGVETPAVYRPSSSTFYFRWTNTPGNADDESTWGEPGWLPVSGDLG